MYKITATQDFVDMLQELPIKYVAILTSSFIKVEKIEDEQDSTEVENTFMQDLLSQINHQELE